MSEIVYDTDDEEIPKKRGRPKKKEIKKRRNRYDRIIGGGNVDVNVNV